MDILVFGDPLCSALTMLAEEAITEYQQQQHNTSIPSRIKKITFRVGPKKSTKSAAFTALATVAADQLLKIHNLHKAETSHFKKPIDLCSKKPNEFLPSAFEGSSTSIPSHIKKITFHVGRKKNAVDDEEAFKAETSGSKKPIKVMDSDANDVVKEEASSSKKPIMGSAIVGAEPANFEEDDHVLRMKKGKGLKRTHETFISDAVDAEWFPGESSSSNTKKKQKKSGHPQEAEPSVLSQEFVDKINEMGGTEITLVFSKVLYTTDLTKQANRLLMPLRKIKNAGFLREGELQELKEKMQVPLIQPSLEVTTLTLTLWDMSKENGTTNYYYALITNWKKVVDANQLKEGDLVQALEMAKEEAKKMIEEEEAKVKEEST
ncbi:hypothetical protein RIF29_19327 [Crotalaria pallida]|uniref:Uncharacterized protein n=1 Tax=Crotalaria pallida TaxID=3830 RepID=A0AAN9I5E3_CROPI